MTNKLLSLCCRQLAESEIIIEDKNAEIERLKLTDKEIEAVAYFAVIEGDNYLTAANTAAATLRNLLERTKDK